MPTSGRLDFNDFMFRPTASKPPSFPFSTTNATAVATALASQPRPSSSTPLASTPRQPIASPSRQPRQPSSVPTPLSRTASRPSRPSHPTLPVIEVSSDDPHAAAQATNIVKNNNYVEFSLDVPNELLGGVETVEREEEELAIKPKGSATMPSSGWFAKSVDTWKSWFARPGPEEEEEGEAEGSESDAEGEQAERERPPKDWRKLETAFVEAVREARNAGEKKPSRDLIVESFLKKLSQEGTQLEGDWSRYASTTRTGTLIRTDAGLSYREQLGYGIDAIEECRARDRRIARAIALAAALSSTTIIGGAYTTIPRPNLPPTLDAEPLPRLSASSNPEPEDRQWTETEWKKLDKAV